MIEGRGRLARTFVVNVLALALAAGCSGPRAPVAIGIKPVPSDVLLGPGAGRSPGTVSTSPGDATTGARRVLGSTPAASGVAASDVVCSKASPLDFAKTPAESNLVSPPAEAEYRYRAGAWVNDGSLPVPDASFSVAAVRRVHDVVVEDSDHFSFSVTDEGGGASVTTGFAVVNSAATDQVPDPPPVDDSEIPDADTPPLPAPPGRGLFMTSLRIVTDDGPTLEVAPQPPLLLTPLPIQTGEEWLAVGIDSARFTVALLTVRVGVERPDPDDPDTLRLVPKASVDACGKVLQGWYVEISDGRVLGPDTDVSLSSLRALAPQYGGISILETFEATGTVSGAELAVDRELTITGEPASPGSARS